MFLYLLVLVQVLLLTSVGGGAYLRLIMPQPEQMLDQLYWAVASVYCIYGIRSDFTRRIPLLQLGKARTRRDIMDGWIIEGNEYQPGLLDILKAARTPEVGAQCSICQGSQVCSVLFSLPSLSSLSSGG